MLGWRCQRKSQSNAGKDDDNTSQTTKINVQMGLSACPALVEGCFGKVGRRSMQTDVWD